MITYGDLYLFLEKHFAQRQKRPRNVEPFFLTKQFCNTYHINNPSRIVQILSDFGASNDIEVLWNVVEMIPDETPIDKDIDTPVEFAIKNDLYTKWHEGMWVRCKKDDKGSMPDLNTAYQKLYNKKNKHD